LDGTRNRAFDERLSREEAFGMDELTWSCTALNPKSTGSGALAMLEICGEAIDYSIGGEGDFEDDEPSQSMLQHRPSPL
jgi:hypothetical protein